jgi:hypothetical protein
LDYEDETQHEIVVRATSVDGSSATRSFVIQLNDVDEFDITSSISDLDSASDSVNENAAIGTSVGIRANAYDLDGTTNTVTYSLDDDAGGRFAIDAVSGVVTTAAMLDFEAQSSWGITVQALSEDGSTATSNFTVAVLNVFERPVGIAEQYVTSYIDDLVLTGTGLLANDFDPDGDAISAVLVSGPGRGSLVSFFANGGLRYTPERGFIGTVEIVYQAFDGMFLSDPVTVTIYVVIPDNLPSNDSSSDNNSGASGQISTNTISTEAIMAAVSPVEEAPTLVSQTVPVSVYVAPAEHVAYVPDVTAMERGAFQASGAGQRMGEMGRRHLSRAGHFEIQTFRSSDRVHGYDGMSNHMDEMSHQQISMDSVLINTVLGTGIILWIAQAVQLAATLISVSPAWMHFDPLSIMPSLDNNRGKKEELSAGEKLFDK